MLLQPVKHCDHCCAPTHQGHICLFRYLTFVPPPVANCLLLLPALVPHNCQSFFEIGLVKVLLPTASGFVVFPTWAPGSLRARNSSRQRPPTAGLPVELPPKRTTACLSCSCRSLQRPNVRHATLERGQCAAQENRGKRAGNQMAAKLTNATATFTTTCSTTTTIPTTATTTTAATPTNY